MLSLCSLDAVWLRREVFFLVFFFRRCRRLRLHCRSIPFTLNTIQTQSGQVLILSWTTCSAPELPVWFLQQQPFFLCRFGFLFPLPPFSKGILHSLCSAFADESKPWLLIHRKEKILFFCLYLCVLIFDFGRALFVRHFRNARTLNASFHAFPSLSLSLSCLSFWLESSSVDQKSVSFSFSSVFFCAFSCFVRKLTQISLLPVEVQLETDRFWLFKISTSFDRPPFLIFVFVHQIG